MPKQLLWVPSGRRSKVRRQIGRRRNAPSNQATSSRTIGGLDGYEQRRRGFGAVEAAGATLSTNGLRNEARWAAEPSHDVIPLKTRASGASDGLGSDGATTQLWCSKERGSLPMVVHRLAAKDQSQPKQGHKLLHRRRASSEEGELQFGLRGDPGAEAASCCW